MTPVWQDSHHLGGTKKTITEGLRGSGSAMRGTAGYLCHFPYLTRPLNPFKDVVILLGTEAAMEGRFSCAFEWMPDLMENRLVLFRL